jgi:PAS domain S-box-containing protein
MNNTDNLDYKTNGATENQLEEKRKIKVLHVDDSEDFINLFSLAFRKWFDVTSVSDSLKAMDMIRTSQFEAVVTDYDMSGMNGLDLLKAIRKEFPYLPVMFYTGQGNEEITREAFLSGVTDYFTKEFRGFSMKERLVNSVKHAVDRMRTETAYLREKDKALRYFNIANVITLLLNADQRVEMVNNFGLDLLGYKEEEILGKNWFDTAVPPDIREKRKTWFNKIITEQKQLKVTDESEIITKNGEIKTIAWSNSLVRNEQGQIEAILRSGQDITERKLTEKHIRHLNRVLKTIRNINQIIFQETHKQKLIQEVCQSLVKVVEYKSALIVIFDNQMRLIEAGHAGFDKDFSVFRDSLEKGEYPACIKETIKRKSILFVDDNYEICENCSFKDLISENSRIIIPIKKENSVIGIIMVAFSPEMDIDHEEQQLLQDVANDMSYALTNIDLRKVHEEYEWSLIQSEENYRTVFDQANHAIFIFDADSDKIVDANLIACEMFEMTMEEIRQIKKEDFRSGTTDDQALEKFQQVLKGKPQTFETQVMDKKGRQFPVEVNAKKIMLQDHETVLINVRYIGDN